MNKPAAVPPILLLTLVLAFTVACHSTEEPPPETNAFGEVEGAEDPTPEADRRRKAHAQAEGSEFLSEDDEIVEEEETPRDFGSLAQEGEAGESGDDGSEPED